MIKRVLAGALVLSVSGVALLKGFEGEELVAYPDVIGVPTVCAGITRGVQLGDRYTPAECTTRLLEETGIAGKAIAACTTAAVTQGQYDVLVSFTYNVGASAYCKSTLVRKLNAGDCSGAADQFKRWNRAGGRVIRGLTARRNAEAALFRKDCA